MPRSLLCPPRILVVLCVFPTRAEILLGDLSRMFCPTKSSVRRHASRACPFPGSRTLQAFQNVCGHCKTAHQPRTRLQPPYEAIPAIVRERYLVQRAERVALIRKTWGPRISISFPSVEIYPRSTIQRLVFLK